MAGVFYSRYVPPTKCSPPATTLHEEHGSGKGKRKRDGTHAITQEENKNFRQRLNSDKSNRAEQRPVERNPRKSRPASDNPKTSDLQRQSNAVASPPRHGFISQEKSSLSKQSSQRSRVDGEETNLTARRNLVAEKKNQKEPLTEPTEEEGAARRHERHHFPRDSPPPVKVSKKGKKNKKPPNPEQETETLNTNLSNHKKISSRYNRSIEAQTMMKAQAGEDGSGSAHESDLPKQNIHGLEPIPQPSLPESIPGQPSFSSLPSWLANTTRVSNEETCSFEKLGIGPRLLANLRDHGLTEALPVQKALIPPLLAARYDYANDLCVSAPTGSGKTLAYALPMINSLASQTSTCLRGLIVVPTRELVTQVFKVCEMCALGLNIQITTATGSKSMKEEQALLVERMLKFDPNAYQRTYANPLTPSDWDTFGLEELIDDLDQAQDGRPGYIPDYKSKIDLLICTPGRLVDHVQSTKGFSLNNLEWFVIDEADKLLDDSFQEWVEVILPKLEDPFPTSLADKVLADLGIGGLPKSIQKVILSATMTEDISKLNSLHLHNPRLVVVHGMEIDPAIRAADLQDEARDQHGAFHLPGSLNELAIPVGDGMKKPLFLLYLMKRYLRSSPIEVESDETHASETSSEDTEDTDSTDSESSEDASDASDPTSDSSRSYNSSIKTSHPLTQKKQTAPTSALIFTRSSEAASRLHRLLILLEPHYDQSIATITRSSNSASSRNAISSFQQGKISILIATDRASRGLDLPNLGNVVSYDMPSSIKAYVHRVGRTARAGKSGNAWTLVAHREGRWFWQEIGKTNQIKRSCAVKKEKLQLPVGTSLEERYEKALSQLKEDVEGR
ncbi:MAG: hypothetical protein Q9160_002741 [Pyrenula sp. 1 TL-2023]